MADTSTMTPADFAALNHDHDGFGNDGSWWIIILFLFMFAGWGGNGGFGNNTSSGASENYVLASDFATLQRQIDASADRLGTQNVAISNGLCEGFYTQAQLINGVNSNIMSQANAMNVANLQGFNANQNTMNTGFAQVQYNQAANTCAITNAMNTNSRDIVDAQNASTQAILAAIQQNKVDAMQDKIAEQQVQITALNLAASQQAQNNYLIEQLRPAPVPSYPASNLYNYTNCNC